jgi:rhodanese-related sulfurtransferase
MGAKASEKVSIEEARRAIAGGDADALDIREEEDWSKAHVPGAIHVPRDRLSSGIDELDPDRRLIVFAGDEGSGNEAVSTLRERGFDVALAEGGIDDWISEDFRTQPTEDPDEDTELGAG